MLMAERNWLIRPLPLPCHPRRALQTVQRDTERDDDDTCQYQAEPCQSVRTTIKDLRHECFPLPRSLPLVEVWRSLYRPHPGGSRYTHPGSIRKLYSCLDARAELHFTRYCQVLCPRVTKV